MIGLGILEITLLALVGAAVVAVALYFALRRPDEGGD